MRLAEVQVPYVARKCGLPHPEPALAHDPLQVLLAGKAAVLECVENGSLAKRFIHREYLFTMVNNYFFILRTEREMSRGNDRISRMKDY